MDSRPEPKTIDEYLARLAIWHRFMPRHERETALQEVRLHLEALIHSAESSGCTSEEAFQSVVQQFGDPDEIGQKIFRDWKKHYWASFWKKQYLSLLQPFQLIRQQSSIAQLLMIVQIVGATALPLVLTNASWWIVLPYAAIIGTAYGFQFALTMDPKMLLKTTMNSVLAEVEKTPLESINPGPGNVSLNQKGIQHSIVVMYHPLKGLNLRFFCLYAIGYAYAFLHSHIVMVSKLGVCLITVFFVSHIVDCVVRHIRLKQAILEVA